MSNLESPSAPELSPKEVELASHLVDGEAPETLTDLVGRAFCAPRAGGKDSLRQFGLQILCRCVMRRLAISEPWGSLRPATALPEHRPGRDSPAGALFDQGLEVASFVIDDVSLLSVQLVIDVLESRATDHCVVRPVRLRAERYQVGVSPYRAEVDMRGYVRATPSDPGLSNYEAISLFMEWAAANAPEVLELVVGHQATEVRASFKAASQEKAELLAEYLEKWQRSLVVSRPQHLVPASSA